MSKLFRTKDSLTIAQLTAAWSPELVEGEEDPKQFEQNLSHILLEDILNGHLDDSGPTRDDGQRLGLRLITPEYKAGFIKGSQLLELIQTDRSWVLHKVVIMKEAVLDFAKRRQLRPPSWWAETLETSPQATNEKAGGTVEGGTSLGGKQARIIRYLARQFPHGVPEPSLRPRNLLRDEVLRGDPTLRRLDEATLKKAIDTYNASLTKQNLDPK
jgi:hypothetical protein